MKKLQIIVIVFLISFAVCAFMSVQAVKAAPTITLSPNTGQIGETVTVSGQGFTILSFITIKFDSTTVETSPGSIVAGIDGSFNAVFNVPIAPIGTRTVTASGGSGGSNSGSASFTLTSNLVAPTISASPGTIYQGQTSALSSTPVTTGSSPYTFQWRSKAPGGSFQSISGANSGTYSFVTSISTTPGSWSFELQVTDAASKIVTSNAVSVIVNSVPTVSVSPTSWIMDVGQSKTFVASPTGGSGSYSNYQWYVGGVAQSSATGSTFSFSPTSAGSYSVTATVTDSLGSTSPQSSAASVVVSAPPTVSITPLGPLLMDIGQTQSFTATRSGGSGSISYQWYLDGNTVGSNSAIYSYTAAGASHSVTCRVTDSASTPVTFTSTPVSITVSTSPTVSIAPVGPLNIALGQSQILTATPSGGSGPISYQWYLASAPVSGATSSTYSFSSNTVGSYSVTCTVTDSASNPVTSPFSNAVSITVNSIPSVSVSPSSWTMDVGQSKQFTATATGGSRSYTSYRWYVEGVAQSGSTGSTFSYSASSAGSFSITVTVTDSLGSTSPQSSPASVVVSASPTVSITPVGPLTIDAGQSQILTATPLGGSGTIHYQWYLMENAVPGATSSTYSFSNSVGSYSVTCRVTDSASTPVTSPFSNAVSIRVNSALVAPTVSATPNSINQGQTSSLTSSSVTTGTSPYTYQWFQRVPEGTYVAVGSNSASFSFVTSGSTVTGSWSFILQVTDAAGSSVNSSYVPVTVNLNPLDHFIFSSIGTQTAGIPFTITITAKNTLNNTITNYVGTNILNVSIGSTSPALTSNFVNGVWTGQVTVTGTGSGVWLSTSGSGMTGTSGSFTVNPGPLDHFAFSTISAQTSGSAFNIGVTAQDAFNNTITSYVGAPSLTCSAGSINPTTMTAFVGGVGSTSVTIASSGPSVTITVTDVSHSGTSNSFPVTVEATTNPTSNPTTNPTSQPNPTPTTSPTNNPFPTPIPNSIIMTALTDGGKNVSLTFLGDITSSSITSISIKTDGSNTTTTVSLAVVAQSKTSGFNNVTIPITAIPYGKTPTIYVNNGVAPNQGFTNDAKNYYVWYKTSYPTYELSISFDTQAGPANFPIWIFLVSIPAVAIVTSLVLARKKIGKLLAQKEDDYSDYV